MRLLYSNLIDLAGVTFTPATYDASFPASNLANEHRSNPYRTGVTQAAESVIIDLGSAKAVTCVVLLDHTLTNADTLIKLQANSSNSWGAPPVDETLTWATGTISKFFASVSYRYWRLIFTKSAAAESRDIGRMFLGTYYTLEEPAENAEFPDKDLTQRIRSEGGQFWSDAQESFRLMPVSFSGISQTQKNNMRTFSEYVKTHTSFFVQLDENDSSLNELVYVKLNELPNYEPDGFHSGGGLAYKTKLEMEEML